MRHNGCMRRKLTYSKPRQSQNTVHRTLPTDLVVFALTGGPSSYFLHSLDDILNPSCRYCAILKVFLDDTFYSTNTDAEFSRNVSNIHPTILQNELLYAANVVWCDAGFTAVLECFGPLKYGSPTQAPLLPN
ncbi:uncharacterized protein LOC143198887 [Rhynchophorus ferrugineus]|uniref:uncharacterized protein LOC143198887 n=1 Tax=Rhynchophorus ferrugineus TaxID=354439 RepID=UPI003FCD49CC